MNANVLDAALGTYPYVIFTFDIPVVIATPLVLPAWSDLQDGAPDAYGPLAGNQLALAWSGASSGDEIEVPDSDPALRTASGGYVHAITINID